jgi:hypothetical protein
MRREWSPEELIESWTLLGQDWTLVGNKSGATRLGFALLLKFFEVEARFPRNADELPPVAVTYVGEQVKVAPALLAAYSWSGRSIKYHREQIRDAFGFREFTRGDEDKLAGWLAEEVCPVELRDQQLREALLVRCRAERIEPPGRVDRIIGSARGGVRATILRPHPGPTRPGERGRAGGPRRRGRRSAIVGAGAAG